MKKSGRLVRLSALTLLACLPSAAAEPPSPKVLRVLTYNIHHGAGMDGKLDLPRIAKVITAQRPDVVMLQEVDRNCTRSGKVDQAAELAKLTGMKATFGKAMDLQGGAYGQAILFRWPLKNVQIHRLPGSGEPRIAISGTLELPRISITVATVHLDYEAQQDAQAAACAEAMRQIPHLILAGDFNAEPGSAVLAHFGKPEWSVLAKKAPAASYPADKPANQIDHFVLRGLKAAEPATVIPESAASDHCPVLAVVSLPE